MLCTFTLLSRASNCSYRSAKLMLSVSSSSFSENSHVAVFSVSWLKILSHSSEFSLSSYASSVVSFSATASLASWMNMLSHSSECSFFSPAWAASDICSNPSSLTVSADYSSVVVASYATQTSASSELSGRGISIPPIIRRSFRSSSFVSCTY
jgi:hypothetical protein